MGLLLNVLLVKVVATVEVVRGAQRPWWNLLVAPRKIGRVWFVGARRIGAGADVEVLTGIGHGAERVEGLAVRVVVDHRPFVIGDRLHFVKCACRRAAWHTRVRRLGGLLIEGVLVKRGVVEGHWKVHVVLVVVQREDKGVHRLHRAGHGHEGIGVHSGCHRIAVGGGSRHEVDGRGL